MIDHKSLIIGKQYKLPHGGGVLVGLEQFKPNGMESYISTDFSRATSSSRFIFDLDPNNTWAFDDSRYAAWGNDIQEMT